ncbi:MAG: aldehyde dehydrogenase [Spirochaetaceae bacterium]|nr:aldehyde dehydrogenase [Spirochaetaceae bacterium]
MTQTEIKALLEKQQKYFRTGATLPVDTRIKALKKLYAYIKNHESEITGALTADLGKSSFEGYMCEVGLVLGEITYMLKHIRKFARDKKRLTSITNYVASTYVKKSPYGTVLIMSPWNYPFMLTIEPLVDAIAAGNTVVAKPSAYSPNTSAVIEKIIGGCFEPEQAAVVTGGRAENTCLLEQKFDYIFFTGSQTVGHEVMRKAAENLTPVTLELGGKSPCIVDKTANIALTATRIVWGKFLNCGQTCVAPDYILCHEAVKDKLIAELKKQIEKQYGKDPLSNVSYGKIINQKHFGRVCSLIDGAKVVHGGKTDAAKLKIEPTVMDNITWNDAVMQQEVFGPVLPVLTYKDEKEIFDTVNSHSKPLALYIFTRDNKLAKKVTGMCSFGGGCINDTIVHLATNNMGFGGVGESGMGAYHGKYGFDTFSHEKSIVNKKNWIDVPMRYQPYTKLNEFLLRMFMK